MRKKVLVATLTALATAASMASAAPQTSWEQGEWQLDLGAWAPKAKFASNESSSKWNFNGGLGYPMLRRSTTKICRSAALTMWPSMQLTTVSAAAA